MLSKARMCEQLAEIIKSRSFCGSALIRALEGSTKARSTLAVVLLALPCSPCSASTG